ncbi:hypothetical protein B0H13DRAFT_2660635 [Mycena leptocephala]|nr:hypothetical protein B0H13DRAFT_2660635 [Mycena leptocephala]
MPLIRDNRRTTHRQTLAPRPYLTNCRPRRFFVAVSHVKSLPVNTNDAPSESSGRGRATPGPTASSRKRPNRAPAPSPPPPKRTRQEPQFAEGFVPGIAGAKPKASDYEPTVQALLIRGMAEYSMRILTIKAFPPVEMQMGWAKECFRNACRAAGLHYSITERMIKLMIKRGSHVRSQIVTACRALFAPHYKFNRTSTSTSAINANRDLSAKLKDGAAYHYKDVEASTGYAGNSILPDIRHAVVFKNKKSLGVIFASHFSPYPLPTLAMEFTVLDFCTSEWSTGVHVPAEFSEKEVLQSYETHLNDIKHWASMNEGVVDNLRRKWYTRAIRSFGPAASSNSSTHINRSREEALRAELAGRTGETDSETELPDAAQAE